MDEERDSHGRTREDYLADEADRKRKIERERELRELDEAYERGRAAHAQRLAEARRLDGPDGL